MTIPDSYIMRVDREELAGQRTISVRRFGTSIEFDRDHIIQGLQQSKLVFGNEFGVIREYDLDNPDRNIRALCGLVGERNIVLINEDTNDLDYLRLKHVLIATLMVEFIENTHGEIELLVYGGKQGLNQLWELLKYDFGINPPPIPRQFSLSAVRTLCERFFETLFEINIDPFEQDGWGTISVADFKSNRGQYILPTAKRMDQIRQNQQIRIRSFESIVFRQFIDPMQQDCDVRFKLLKDSGISLTIPELELPSSLNDLEYEIVFYDFARYVYSNIIEVEQMYEPLPRLGQQLSLIDTSPNS